MPWLWTRYIRCLTLRKVNKIINRCGFNTPQSFTLHCGANVLESTTSHEEMIQKNAITASITEKHPKSKVILSSLLPRKDDLDKRISNVNEALEKEYAQHPNVTVVKHQS